MKLHEIIAKHQQAYEKAFDTLIREEEPAFSRQATAAFDLYETYNSYPDETLEYMNKELRSRSNGEAYLEPASFPTGIRGRNRQFYLHIGETTHKLSFSPSQPPFEFED